jgi:hypothetical protein
MFFILNKMDLLSPDDRSALVAYSADVLGKELLLSRDVKIWPVSARLGVGADDESPAWTESGMAAVKTDIIDFLSREKYFALAETVAGKCSISLDAVKDLLEQDRVDLNQPFADIDDAMTAGSRTKTAIHAALGMEQGHLAWEENECASNGRDLLLRSKEVVTEKFRIQIEKVIAEAAVLQHPATIITDAARQLATSLCSEIFWTIRQSLDVRLRENAATHCRRLIELLTKQNIQALSSISDTIEKLRISAGLSVSHLESSESPFILPEAWSRLLPMSLLPGKSYKIKHCTTLYTPLCMEYLETRFQELGGYLTKVTGSAVREFSKKLSEVYQIVLAAIETEKENLTEKKEHLGQVVNAQIEHIDALIATTRDIRSLLL